MSRQDEITQDFTLNAPQRRFVNSSARYPAFVGSWGCGKTMCGIFRGMGLSERFDNNLGLIVRKKFTDLRDSTLKDFERYTGLSVKKESKEVDLPNGSIIMFRHGEELTALQNVNLGWFMIEQAEEFDTAEQFDLLRGRLRRQESGVRQGMVIANTCGHNWIWNRWKKQQLESYELTEASIIDNREHLPADTVADWERLRVESPKKYARYVENSWEDYDMEGAYYAALMSDALKQGRIDRLGLLEPGQPVYTFWDLGVRASDTTVIWFVQFIRNQIWLIDYYENYGQGMDYYNDVLNKKPYNYVQHWFPPDAVARVQGRDITTRLDIMRDHRQPKHEQVLLVDRHEVQDRISVVRGMLHLCWFSDKCEQGIEALNHYRTEPKELLSQDGRPAMRDKPKDDWSTNGSDAFGYMAWVFRFQLRVKEQRIGLPFAERQYEIAGSDCPSGNIVDSFLKG